MPHRRLHPHQVAYVCLLARLITSASSSPASAATKLQAASGVCSTNLALRRPCEPAPGCAALVDDDNQTTLPEALVTDRFSEEQAAGSGEAMKTAASKFGHGQTMFRVFLKRTYNLTRIVIFCFEAHGQNSTRTRSSERVGDTNFKHRHTLEVKTWEDTDNASADNGGDNASSHQQLLFNASEIIDGGILRIEFAITEIAAIVAVQTRSVCGGNFKVAEVAVMGRDVASPLDDNTPGRSAEPSESRRRRGNANVDSSGEIAASERRMPSVTAGNVAAAAAIIPSELEGPSAFSASGEATGEWLNKQPSQGLPASSSNGFLAPSAAMAAGSQAAVLWFAMIGVSTLALSLLCISSKWIQAPEPLGGPLSPDRHARYRAISSAEDQEAGAARPVHHWIGDSDESRPASPRPFLSPLISSESEPECEMDPSGSEQAVCAPSLLGRTAVLEHMVPKPPSSTESQHLLSSSSSSCSSGLSSGSRPAGGRVTLLYASPLCHVHQERGPIAMPQIPFEREWEMLIEAGKEAATDLSPPRSARAATRRCHMTVELAAEPLTAKSLQRCVAPSSASAAPKVLHLSAHGLGDRLVLENGKGTAHFFCCDNLRAMLNLRQEVRAVGKSDEPIGLRLVVLNACSSRPAGLQFVEGGVPHVICASVDIRDSVSGLFLRALYSSLFQGCTVAGAFESALVALRSDPDIPFVDAFRLLPEGVSHEEILFPPETSAEPQPLALKRSISNSSDGSHEGPSSDSEGGGASSSNDNGSADEHVQLLRPRHEQKLVAKPPPQPPPARVAITRATLGPTVVHSPFGRIVPPLPEDFVGRSLDVWTILQHLSNRRVVVVCGSTASDYGIGKSAVMDAAHRAFTLQVGGACIAVHLRTLSDPNAATAACEGGWIEKVMEQVHRGIQDRQRRRLPALPHHVALGNSACGSGGSKDDASASGNHMLRRRLNRSRGPAVANRAVRHGFHPLSDPIAAAPALEALVSDMLLLSELCEARCGRDWPAGSSANSRILLILDECDHLIQQEHFQEAISDLLRRCPAYRMLISTQQPMHMVSSSLGQFKVVHHALEKLNEQDSARLFLRRAGRPIRWEELVTSPAERVNISGVAVPALEQAASVSRGGAACNVPGSHNPAAPVALTRENEAEVLGLVSAHPCVKAQSGNPRRLIELASLVTPSLTNLRDLEASLTAVKATRKPPAPMASPALRTARVPEDEEVAELTEEVGELTEMVPLLGD